MVVPVDSYTAITTGQVDPDSPLDTTLMAALRANDRHLREILYGSGSGTFFTPQIGHDHDGTNSVKVQGAATGTIDQTAIGASAVGQGELKTSTEDETASETAATVVFASAASYGFFPRIKATGGTTSLFNAAAATTSATLVTAIHLTGTGLATATMRYVTASGDVFWVWILRDKITKDILRVHTAPDHPAMSTGDPETMPHAFPEGYDPEKHEIICITSPKDIDGKYNTLIEDLHKKAHATGKSVSELVIEDYLIDEESDPVWPVDDVTVGYDTDGEDLMDIYHSNNNLDKVKLKKVNILKPSYVIHKSLRKKVT